MRFISYVLAAALFALAVPAFAQAQGNSGIDQYTEQPPSAGGNGNGGNGGGGSGGSGGGGSSSNAGGSGAGSALPASSQQDLEQLGADGAAAAGLANETAPDGAKSSKSNENGGDGENSSGGANGVALEADTESEPAALAGAIGGEDSDGLGIVLPIVLGISLLAAIAVMLIRRRTGSEG